MINKKTMTLEQYNKKYRNRTEYLIKLKKSVADSYNKKFEHVVGNQYLFNGHKWQLIGDTYYQIPRCPSYTWFRNLHAGAQIAICVLLGGAIVGGAATPLILNLVNVPIVVDSNEVIFTYKKDIKGNINANIKTKDNTYEIKSIVIKTSNYEFVKDQDYTYDFKTGNIVIKSEAIKQHKGKIHIVPAVTAIKVESVECERTLVLDYGGVKPGSDLHVKVFPENAHDKAIKNYQIEGGLDNSPFEIKEDTENPGKYKLHAKSGKSGTAKLTLYAGDNNASTECYVTVMPQEQTYTYLTFEDNLNDTTKCSVKFANDISAAPANVVIPDHKPNEPARKVTKFNANYSLFSGQDKITTITLPNTLNEIDINAFTNFNKLTALNFNGESNLTTIGNGAFSMCSELEWFKISNNLSSIGVTCFNSCSSIKFILEEGVTNFSVSSDKTMLFNKTQSELIAAPSVDGKVDLSTYDSLTKIHDSSFAGNSKLTEIVFPSNLKTIPTQCFYNCTGLNSVNFPNQLETIKGTAFSGCKSLSSVVFPTTLKSIGASAFYCPNGGLESAEFKDTTHKWTVGTLFTEYDVTNKSTNAENLKKDGNKYYAWTRNEQLLN